MFPVSTTDFILGLGLYYRTKQPRRPKAEFCVYCAYCVGQFITLAKSGGSFNPSMQKHSVLRPLITLSQGLAVGGMRMDGVSGINEIQILSGSFSTL